MKKTTFALLLSSLMLLVACNSKNEKSVSSSSSVANTTASSTLKTSDSTSTSDTQIFSSSVSSEEQTVILSEESQNTQDSATIPEMSQEQALQRILESYPDTNNEDVSLIFWQMIDADFLFKAYSKSISSQGGSGTLGFFRVSPQGNVSITDATGNPI